MQNWADLVEEATNGRLKADIFFGGTLGYSMEDTFPAMQSGALDVTWASGVYIPVASQKDAWWGYADIVGLFENHEQQDYVNEAMKPALKETLKDLGGVVDLAWYSSDPAYCFAGIYTNKVIKSLDDFEGMKLRIYFPLAREKQLPRLGMSGIYIPSSECYQALKTNLVDGIWRDPIPGMSSHYYDVAKYYYAAAPKSGAVAGVFCSEKSLDALPLDVRAGVLEGSRQHNEFVRTELMMNLCDYTPGNLTDPPGWGGSLCLRETVDFLQEQGMTMYYVPKFQQAVHEVALEVFDEWVAEYGTPEILKAAKAVAEAQELFPGVTNEIYLSLEELDLAD